jgi:phage-related minor tail protein
MDIDSDDLATSITGTQALAQALTDLESRSARFGSALSGALKSATVSGRSLEDVLGKLALRLTDVGLSSALKPLEGLVSGAATSLIGSIGSVTPFAEGGVVRSPAMFSMGGGLGLMGEAGAEAIMPLRRGPDGALGVSVAGAGAGTPPQIVFNVTASDAASFRKSEPQISALLARSVARGRRGL